MSDVSAILNLVNSIKLKFVPSQFEGSLLSRPLSLHEWQI